MVVFREGQWAGSMVWWWVVFKEGKVSIQLTPWGGVQGRKGQYTGNTVGWCSGKERSVYR